jgi:hypothetical protein
MKHITLTFISQNRKAECPPDPRYPEGIHLDPQRLPACRVDLPYPAPCVGVWYIECDRCKTVVAVTAAGRPDDPRSIMLPCKDPSHAH